MQHVQAGKRSGMRQYLVAKRNTDQKLRFTNVLTDLQMSYLFLIKVVNISY